MIHPLAAAKQGAGAGDAEPQRGRLLELARDLVRARSDQLLLDHLWLAVFCALIAATAWVAAVRFVPLDLPAAPGVALALLAALVAARVAAWWRRPDDLAVVIAADVRLGLDQVLSTAFELHRRGAAPELVERLAAQAMRRRHIAYSAPRAFPRRATPWARATPLALVVLLLVGIVEVPEPPPVQEVVVDTLVAREGERLARHALRMEERAAREQLPRAGEQAERMQRLGGSMRSGALSREQALVRLRDMGGELAESARLAAAAETEQGLSPGALDDLVESPLFQGGALEDLFDRLRDGRLGAGDLDRFAASADLLRDLGIPPDDVRRALDRYAEGDQAELRELLEELKRMAQAAREIEELRIAEEATRLARENLGDPDAGHGQGMARTDEEPDPDREVESVVIDSGDSHRPIDGGPRDLVYLAARGSGAGRDADARPGARPRLDGGDGDHLLRPRARPGGEGPVRRSEARVLPSQGSITTDTAIIDRRFSTQVEEVLAKEDIPLHAKELVRRYFLTLGGRDDLAGEGRP